MITKILRNQDVNSAIRVNPIITMARKVLRKNLLELKTGRVLLSDPLDYETEVIREGDIVVTINDLRFYTDILMSGSKGHVMISLVCSG
ncbi:MAG: hypothetical protein ACKVHQ_07820 [Gammaproteobacteria bacterium]